MSVYVVFQEDYDDHHIDGIYTDRQVAIDDRFLHLVRQDNTWGLYEYPLNLPEAEPTNLGATVWSEQEERDQKLLRKLNHLADAPRREILLQQQKRINQEFHQRCQAAQSRCAVPASSMT